MQFISTFRGALGICAGMAPGLYSRIDAGLDGPETYMLNKESMERG